MTGPNPRLARGKFTGQFRADAIRLATSSQTTIARTAREVGTHDTLIRTGPAATEQAVAAMQRLYAALGPAVRALREG